MCLLIGFGTRKLYNWSISDTSKFKKFNEDPTLKHEAPLQRFLHKLKQKSFLTKMNIINYLFDSATARIYDTPKMHNFPLVINSLNFVQLLHLDVLLIVILPIFFCHLLSPLVPNDSSCKDTFSFVSQINNANFSITFLVSHNVTKSC